MRTAESSSRKPIWPWKKVVGVLAVAVVPLALVYLVTRTRLFRSVLDLLGADVFLGVAVLLLVIFTLVALGALIYGFGLEDPLRRERRGRRDSQ
jgi:hypothetical protein